MADHFAAELRAAVAAVRRATRVCRAVQAELITAETLEKKDKSPVTVADFASQAVVCHALAQAFPNDSVVGEEDAADLRDPEGKATKTQVISRVQAELGDDLTEDDILDAIDRGGYDPAEHPDKASRYWTLDPIDGTKGFLRGEQYAVALALIEQGTVVLGVLGCPNLEGGLLLTAAKGQGCQRLPIEADDLSDPAGEKAQANALSEPKDARLVESVESGHSDQGASATIAKALGITAEPVRIDSQCKYAAVAMGLADVYLRLPTRKGYEEKIWDHAAGWICVQEAGGAVTDTRGVPLDFSIGRTLRDNVGVVGTCGAIQGRVVAAVQDALNASAP